VDRIIKVSNYLVKLFYFLLVALPLFSLFGILMMASEPFHSWAVASPFIDFTQKTPEGIVNLLEITFTPLSEIIYLAGRLVSLAPILLSLLVLICLFKNYRQEIFFSSVNTLCYRRLGLLFFLNALFFKPVTELLDVLAITLSNPPGHRYIVLGFGSPNFEDMFIGVLLLIISWVMHKAQVMQEEQQFVI